MMEMHDNYMAEKMRLKEDIMMKEAQLMRQKQLLTEMGLSDPA